MEEKKIIITSIFIFSLIIVFIIGYYSPFVPILLRAICVFAAYFKVSWGSYLLCIIHNKYIFSSWVYNPLGIFLVVYQNTYHNFSWTTKQLEERKHSKFTGLLLVVPANKRKRTKCSEKRSNYIYC